ncbi:MAG: hypothetical protein ACO1QB_17430 [Verrucomicrobiales bacterium]
MATTTATISSVCPNCTAENHTETHGLFTCHTCQQVFDVLPPKAVQAPPPMPKGFKKKGASEPQKSVIPGDKICEDCGQVGYAKTITQGSLLIEIVLWLFMILPGLIYSIWRLTSRKEACRQCKGKLIPLKTPRGQKLFEQMHS